MVPIYDRSDLIQRAISNSRRTLIEVIITVIIVILVFLWLRPRETKRLWPALLPLLVVTHFAAPGTLGSIKAAFFPHGGIVAQQQRTGLGCDSDG